MSRKFVISDVHGCAKSLKKLVEDSLQLSKEDELYLLGDFIDRGPDPKGVIDYIMDLKAKAYQVFTSRGNHEEMMINSILENDGLDLWLLNGGTSTLASFNLDWVSDVPDKYLEFIGRLEYYFEVDNYILVHAGLNFELKDPLTIGKDMLWARWWYDHIDHEWLNGRYIIHGHTPIQENSIRSMRDNIDHLKVLDIDNGCYYHPRKGLGQLCAFELNSKELFFQEYIG